MAKVNPFLFLQQARGEIAKVIWPSRREVGTTTAMVFLLASLAATFFFLVDLAIRGGLRGVLGLFG